MSRIIGLTGGIATGKSTVSAIFQEHGIPVVDADRIAHQLMKKDTEVYRDLVEAFGPEILGPSGEIAREKLGRIVFYDDTQLARLNRIVHPAVKRVMLEQVKQLQSDGSNIIVLDVPLLFESGFDTLCDCTVVVYTEETIQLERLMKRNGISREEALARINAQMPLKEKVKRADVVIDNSFTLEKTKKQVEDLIKRLQRQEIGRR